MIHENSRVWLYQSDRPLNETEIETTIAILKDFTKTWTAHNNQLKATFEIKYNRFIALIVDENQAGASGCSIDKSVHIMKDLEQKFNINLFDRFHIAWKRDNEILSANRQEFEEMIKLGKINSETIVFNNLVQTYSQYLQNWEIQFKDSWHSKVFKLETIV